MAEPMESPFGKSNLTTAEAILQGLKRQRPLKLPLGTLPLDLWVVDRDPATLQALAQAGREIGFAVQADSPEAAAGALEAISCDVALLELEPHPESMALLHAVRQRFPRVPIIVTAAVARVGTVVGAMRQGATDYLAKPFSLDELTATLHEAAERRTFDMQLRRVQVQLRETATVQQLVSVSPAMQKLLTILSRVAGANHPVLVLGESGAGKEYVAQMLHHAHWPHTGSAAVAQDAPGPEFLSVPCRTTPTTNLEAELFGTQTGEGAALLTRAGGGTLFLDEIDALPMELQARLIRALQDRSVRTAGSPQAQPVTVRVVASSSADLPMLVERGLFRKDLYYRLNIVALRVPPLRQRREDLPILAGHVLQRCGEQRNIHFELSIDAMRALLKHEWPGNVRELEAALERACMMSSGPVLGSFDLPSQLRNFAKADEDPEVSRYAPAKTQGAVTQELEIQSIAELERKAIVGTLKTLKGDKLASARLLGIGKTTLYRKLKEYGIADAG